jgi:hypothetical protein
MSIGMIVVLPQFAVLPGVAEPANGYAHYKRRIDPAVQLGRGATFLESPSSGSR